jgi:ABC-type uncharacterized transport system auxiliary subunit
MSIVQHKATRLFGSARLNYLGRVASPLLHAVPLLALLLTGCGASRPIKYFQLTYPTPAPVTQSPLNVSLLVRTFDSLNIYKQTEIVYGWNSNEIGTYELSRWVAPPTELLMSSLVRGLRFSGQFRSVLTVRGEGGGDYALSGYLYEFSEVDGAEIAARLNFVVRLRDRQTGEVLWTHVYNHDEPATEKTVPAVVVAMDKNVQKSVADVSAALAEYFQAHPPKSAQN